MFNALLWKLAKKLVADLVVHQTSEMPAIQIRRYAIETYWTGNYEVIKDFFSDQFVKRFPDLEWCKRSEKMVEERSAEAIRENLFERARGVPD